MKKVLAIILALLMILSLASLVACGEKKTETKETETNEETSPDTNEGEVTEEMLESSKPNEYVQEKLDAGWEVRIDWSLSDENYFTHTQLADAAIAMFAEYGFVGSVYAAEDNSIPNQITQLENLLTMGKSAGVCIQTSDPAAIKDVVLSLQDAGITVVVYGIECEYDTLVAMADVYNCGYGAGVMAADWISVRYPDAKDGEVHVAVLGGQMNAAVVSLTQGMKDSVAADSRFTLSYVGDAEGDTLEHGYDGAQAALMVDPDIRVFLCYQMSAGLGVNNYLEAAGVDFGEFGIFGTSEDDTTEEMLNKAANNESAFRGTISAGGGVPDTTVDVMIEALLGDGVPLGTMKVDPMKAWTSTDYTCDYSIGY
jgi:ABC-type sugar transport system substrate-binding protein